MEGARERGVKDDSWIWGYTFNSAGELGKVQGDEHSPSASHWGPRQRQGAVPEAGAAPRDLGAVCWPPAAHEATWPRKERKRMALQEKPTQRGWPRGREPVKAAPTAVRKTVLP